MPFVELIIIIIIIINSSKVYSGLPKQISF